MTVASWRADTEREREREVSEGSYGVERGGRGKMNKDKNAILLTFENFRSLRAMIITN